MTEAKEIEEILHEASAYGLRNTIIDSAHQKMIQLPKMRRVDAYRESFNQICEPKL